MKVNVSVKKMCSECKVIKRHGVVRVICTNPGINKDKRSERLKNINISVRGMYGKDCRS